MIDHATYVLVSCIVVIVLCSYILYLTWKLAKVEEQNNRLVSYLCHIRSSVCLFHRNYPALYMTHEQFFTKILKFTHSR